MTGTEQTVVLTTFADAKDAYRAKDLRQALYDEGEIVMADVLVNLHGEEHRARRRVENRLFRRETFDHYERDLFPGVIETTVAPYLAAGKVDLVHLGHELLLNLAALTAGIDRPEGTAAETERLYAYMMRFVEGATLAHSTQDKDAQRVVIGQALLDWDAEFLTPSIERRRALDPADRPRDVLTCLMEHADELGLTHEVLRREVAFFLLAAAHTSATAFVRSIDHILGWIAEHPEDAPKAAGDPLFVQRCVHETVRLNPSSPIGKRRALAPVRLRSGMEIPEGSSVIIDLMAVNRDPEVFGPDAAEFNPYRTPPPGVAPFGLSFAAGMHVCIGQDLAAGVVPGNDVDPDNHLFGLVTGAVRYMFTCGVRRDPDDPPVRDANTARPYWGRYPVLLGGDA
ncbi:Cytochrome P450 [Pseudonocardia thermophila]|jgi:Cytochrome P450|uniref:Cytochrome P450 n=1 Tax=Pseudonocardia thermophila TaxID=1848 RepID=A0A1M6T8D5_PSETH|nr:cytochrome P450 [Pseudonocardia thermophila]SHK53146.1 Cytochrome P450 [Pseudonocardia thermophila]